MRKTKGKWALLAGGICMFATAMMVVPSATKAASAGITRVDEDAPKKKGIYDYGENLWLRTNQQTKPKYRKANQKYFSSIS